MKKTIVLFLTFSMFLFLFQFHINPQFEGFELDAVSAATSKPAPTTPTTPTTPSTPIPPAEPATPTVSWSAAPSSWASQEIQSAASYGLTVSNLMQQYNKPITRKEFVQLIMNHYTVSGGVLLTSGNSQPFTDTTDSSVVNAYHLGFVNGQWAGRFNPDGLLTRQEAAVILYREWNALSYNLSEDTLSPLTFTDSNKVSSWAVNAMKFMNQNGILKGSDGNLNPVGNTTREQAMILVLRSYEVHNALTVQTTPDAVSSPTVNQDDDDDDDDDEEDD